MKSIATLLSILLSSSLLSACGGGASDTQATTTGNRPPVISGTPASSVMTGGNYSFTPNASDPDGDNTTFSVQNQPTWCAFDTATGRLSGQPDTGDIGSYSNIVIEISDGTASASLAPFSITVSNLNSPPSISGQPASSVTVGSSYSFTPTVTDTDGDNLTFSVTNPPAWASFNTSNGQLSGSPVSGDIGVYSNITISVSDGSASASLNPFSITVSAQPVASGDIYVDPQIGTSHCSDYNVATRSCAGGDKEAYNTLAGAAAAAIAGNVVEIRAGTYGSSLNPQNSGTGSEPITYRSYNGESVVISGASLTPAIDISNRSYLIIEGLEISNVKRWMYALNAHHNTLRNNVFSGANDSSGSSKTGIFLQEATYNRFLDNVIDDSTQDNISLIKSDNNLIEGNTITNAAHALWVIKCGNRNVVRDNYFHNAAQKIGEIYDCADVGFDHEFYLLDATKYNVIENNVFAKTSTYYSPSGGNGIQHAAQNSIVRYNTFYDNNVGINLQRYSGEAMYNTHNRIYHNTFHKNHCGGVATAYAGSSNYTDNLFVNNIMSENTDCASTRPYQHLLRNSTPDGFVMDHNNLTSGSIPDNVIGIWEGAGNTLAWYESNYPALYTGNLELDPAFSNADNHIYTLQPSSQMVDAGRFLTTTSSAGSGRVIPLLDAGYFHNGFGIDGVQGDSVQLEGTTRVLTVVAVDYSSNTITVNADTSWLSGQGISLPYSGDAPDIGAFERQ